MLKLIIACCYILLPVNNHMVEQKDFENHRYNFLKIFRTFHRKNKFPFLKKNPKNAFRTPSAKDIYTVKIFYTPPPTIIFYAPFITVHELHRGVIRRNAERSTQT